MSRLLLVTLLGLGVACKQVPPTREYRLHGKVISVNAAEKSASIHNDNIPGWMEPMTMDYPIKDPASLSRLHAGDEISATVYVRDIDFWLNKIDIVR